MGFIMRSWKSIAAILGIVGNGAAAVATPGVSAEDAVARSTWITIAWIIARAVENIAKAMVQRAPFDLTPETQKKKP